ncbi:deoxyribose-phosphate aldolase [Oscillospiraceae bacterium PP1C4]
MEHLSPLSLARMIDISCVKANHTLAEINQMIASAKKYQFVCAFALPSYTSYLYEQLKVDPQILVGGAIGFPSGGDTTRTKVFQANELIEIGCGELDMVINLTHLKSHNYKAVLDDISAVVKTAGNIPVKSILEVTLLTEEELVTACKIAVDAGVTFVKTGTGWCSSPTTVEHIRQMKQAVGNQVKIKAAGGIRDLSTLRAMADAGCSRFGIGVASAVSILSQL